MDKNIINNPKMSLLPGLDILKFIMALLVVAIHSEAVNYIPIVYETTLPLINSALPIFFVVSAFLLFRRLRYTKLPSKQNYNILLHFTKRLVYLYLFWMIIQLPLVIYTRKYFSMTFIEFIGNFLLDITLRTTFHGSWFFSALIVGIWIIYGFSKYFKEKIIWIIPLCLSLYTYHAASLPIKYQGLWELYADYITNPQNSFPVSLFWISLGYILANPLIIKTIGKFKKFPLVIVLVIAWCISISYLDLRVFMVVSIFIMALNSKINYKPIFKFMRQSSILIFTLHFIFIVIFRFVFPEIEWLQHGLVLFGILICLCLISSAIVLKLKDNKYFAWLKYSY